jgi:transcriptional regulator with XRE-family HTH domain
MTTSTGQPAVHHGTEHVTEPLLRHLVGAILRRERLAQGRILSEVAGAARMSTAYLSEVERGRKEASSEVLAAVCRALGIRLVDLVGQAHDALAAAVARDEAARGVRVLRAVGAAGGRVSGPTAPHHVRALGTGRRPVDAVMLAA